MKTILSGCFLGTCSDIKLFCWCFLIFFSSDYVVWDEKIYCIRFFFLLFIECLLTLCLITQNAAWWSGCFLHCVLRIFLIEFCNNFMCVYAHTVKMHLLICHSNSHSYPPTHIFLEVIVSFCCCLSSFLPCHKLWHLAPVLLMHIMQHLERPLMHWSKK